MRALLCRLLRHKLRVLEVASSGSGLRVHLNWCSRCNQVLEASARRP